jgi:hypothetical protein
MATSDIFALNDNARRLHLRQGAALATQAVDPKWGDRLRLSVDTIFGTAQQAIDFNRSRAQSVSIVKGQMWLAKSMPACETKSIDDHLFSLLKRIIVGVVKPQQRGERIDIYRFELVCEFFRIH